MRTDDVLALSAEPDAAALARRFVRAAVGAAPADLVADAELVVTELVSNAQLHGVPPIAVRADWDEPVLRVEVADAGPRLPVLPAQSSDAMTGRGLALIAALTSGWGVQPQSSAGKVVWAELGGPMSGEGVDAGLDLEAMLAAWPDDEPDEAEFPVRLGSVPTDLLLDAKRHIEGVVRELTFARSAPSADQHTAAFQVLIETVTNTFAGARDAIKRQALAAAARGDEETDLVLRLPASAADAGERYLEALDEVDRYSRAARLLTLETPPLHALFRRWYVRSIVAQLRSTAAGQEPVRVRPFVRVLADEVTTLSSLRETSERLALLQQVSSDLTSARTQQEICAVVVGHATAALGALAAMVFVADGDVLRAVHEHGGDRRWHQRFEEVPLTADLPGSVVFNSGQPLLLRNLAQMTERFPVLGQVYDSDRLLHVVPLTVGDHRIGILSLSFPPRGELDEDTQTQFVQALADALAQALERASALEEAAAAAERLAFLAEASVALTASLDFQQTVDAVTGLLVPRLADWCTLSVVDGAGLTTVGVRHTDPEKTRWAWDIVRNYPPQLDAPYGDGQVLRTGVSELHLEMPDEVLVAGAHDEEHLRLLREVGMRSAVAVPLPGRDGIIGVLSVIHAESGRRYAASDVAYLEDVARRAALALETARVLREQSGRLAHVLRVAEAAQQAILAEPPDRVGPVALAARYCSATAEALVGGDMYEVVARPGAVRLLIGDVRGKGLAAVRTATVVLGQFRAAAADVDDLAEVARQLDRRVRAYLGEEDFVTALIAEVLDDGSYTVAVCGHPPALVATRGGGLAVLESEPTLPLGLGADPVPVKGRLAVGDRLLLMTDGIIEARDPGRRFVDLLGLVAPLAGKDPLGAALDGVLAALHDAVGPDLGDDLALLVAEFRGASGG